MTWDERRQALWVANANSDAIYRLDPEHRHSAPSIRCRGRWPTCDRLAVDRDGRLIGTYGNYPGRLRPLDGRADRCRRLRAETPMRTVLSLPLRIALAASCWRPRQRRAPSCPMRRPSASSTTKGCNACHAVDEVRIGPPFAWCRHPLRGHGRNGRTGSDKRSASAAQAPGASCRWSATRRYR